MPPDRAVVRLFELGAGRAHDRPSLGLLRHHEGGELGGASAALFALAGASQRVQRDKVRLQVLRGGVAGAQRARRQVMESKTGSACAILMGSLFLLADPGSVLAQPSEAQILDASRSRSTRAISGSPEQQHRSAEERRFIESPRRRSARSLTLGNGGKLRSSQGISRASISRLTLSITRTLSARRPSDRSLRSVERCPTSN
jgi:hypothetical protein